jgi:hypothetical protein
MTQQSQKVRAFTHGQRRAGFAAPQKTLGQFTLRGWKLGKLNCQ